MKSHLKQKALVLRKEGFSYSDIKNKLGVSKSTLSLWLRDIPYTPNKIVKNRLVNAREASKISKRRTQNETKIIAKDKADKKIGNLSKRDLFMFGLGLYCGEGSKTNLTRIVNSDHRIISFAIKWFKTFYAIEDKNITIRIHVYPDTNIAHIRTFWSKVTGIPTSEFQPEYIDTRLRKRPGKTLHHGTAHITIVSKGIRERGVLLLREILASIDNVLGTAGVV